MQENPFIDSDESMPPAPVAVPTVRELDDLIDALEAQEKIIEEKQAALSAENAKLYALEQKAAAYLVELGRESYKGKTRTLRLDEKWRFNLPEGDENRQAFFDHLKEKGLFERYATINANSYNSYCNAEWEIAKSEGRGMEFQLPGVPEPKVVRKIHFPKNRS